MDFRKHAGAEQQQWCQVSSQILVCDVRAVGGCYCWPAAVVQPWSILCVSIRLFSTTKTHQVTGLEKRNGLNNARSATSNFILFGDVPVDSLTLSNQACRLRLKETYTDLREISRRSVQLQEAGWWKPYITPVWNNYLLTSLTDPRPFGASHSRLYLRQSPTSSAPAARLHLHTEVESCSTGGTSTATTV